jgi:hypothetical protein
MNRHLFPLEFQKIMVLRESTYDRLAKAMGKRGYRISKQFIGMLALGQRRVPAQQLKRMCEVLELDQLARQRLHKAACIDMGFDIGGLDG